MKDTNRKFTLGGFKAKQFDCTESEDSDYHYYKVEVKITKPIRKLYKSVSRWSHRMVPMKTPYDFYLEHMEQRCSCQHDCCGHWFTSLAGVKKKGKKYIFTIGTAQNY